MIITTVTQEWPHNWPQFVNELVSACKENETVCENGMHILRLLSEEVFDYSAEQVHQFALGIL